MKEISDMMDKIRIGDRVDLVKIAELELKINKLRLTGVDASKSQAEQLMIMKQVEEAENKLIAYKIADKTEELRLIDLALTKQQTNTVLLNKQAELNAEIINIQGEKSLRIATRKNALLEAEAKAAKKLLDDELAANAWFLKTRQKFEDEDTKIRLDNYKNYLAAKESGLQDEYEVSQYRLEHDRINDLIAAEKNGLDIQWINIKYANLEMQLNKEVSDAKLAVYADFAGAVAGLFGEETVIAKTAAIAQATINTYLGATAAFAQTPGGIIIKSLAAGTAIASGLASVAKILSVDTNVKGGGGSMPTAISSSPAARNITVNQVQSSILTNPQLSQSQLNALPQNMLSAADIANAMSKMPPQIVTVEDINAKVNQVSKIQVRANI
jgi:hypothetical protein